MSDAVYRIITNQILAELQNGLIPWRQPWVPEAAPQNFISGKSYQGINALLLSLPAERFGCPYFATEKQIRNLQGRILETELKKSSIVCFWKWLLVDDHDSGEKRPVGFLRYFRVWSLAQTEGIDWELPAPRQIDPINECDQIVCGYSDGPPVEHDGGSRSYYSLIDDSVHLPHREQFIDSGSYYGVLFHELVHSTGHLSRLDRKLSSDMSSKAYAREELCAEIGSSFLLGSAGFTETIPLTNSAAYIHSWQRSLRDDPRCVVYAASRAQKAADWVLGRRRGVESPVKAAEKEACHAMA